MNIYRKIALIMFLVLIAVFSFTVLADYSTNIENHEHEIDQIDENIETVLSLTAGATATSALISIIPDDTCTPIANQLAELAKYFLIVLSALYLEKYLLTIVGYGAFSILIPGACALWGIGHFKKKDGWKTVAYKLVVCALALYFIIPLSIKVSDMIYQTYDESIQYTIEAVDEITESDPDESTLDQIVSWITDAAQTVTEYISDILSRFVEALAVMIVTSCLIPILVFAIVIWLVKLLFANVPLIQQIPPVISQNASKAIEQKEN